MSSRQHMIQTINALITETCNNFASINHTKKYAHQDCTSDDITTFTCITGIPGGAPPSQQTYQCAAMPYYSQPDYFPMMCVEFENNGYLGMFRYPMVAVRGQAGYDTVKVPFMPDYSFQ